VIEKSNGIVQLIEVCTVRDGGNVAMIGAVKVSCGFALVMIVISAGVSPFGERWACFLLLPLRILGEGTSRA
jgi:hypothetical protein